MKKIVMAIAALFASTAFAQDVARVVRSEPQYVTQYQTECRQVVVEENNSGIGTVIGGVAGGIIGNQVGKGTGKDVATVAGAIIGGSVGNRIGSDQRNTATKQVCDQIPVRVQRGSLVTFDYHGQLFTVHVNR